MINFRIFRDITSPSLFAVHRVDSEGNRVQLMKDNLSFESAQALIDNLKDLKDFEMMEEIQVSL
jgi:hypothetical protein